MNEDVKVELERVKMRNYILEKENEILMGKISALSTEKKELIQNIEKLKTEKINLENHIEKINMEKNETDKGNTIHDRFKKKIGGKK